MPFGVEVGLGPGRIVLDGDPVLLPKKGHSPFQISAHFYYSHTAECIKMPFGMEVGLGPGHIVGTCEASRFDSISNRTSDSGFDS